MAVGGKTNCRTKQRVHLKKTELIFISLQRLSMVDV